MLQVFLIIGILILIVSIFLLYRKISLLSSSKDDQVMKLLSQNIQGISQRFDRATEEIGKVTELGRDMKSFQKDFETFFNSPKLRGNLGEQVLRDLLEQILPKENFELQYKFKEGQTVDAIIKTDKGLISIDAKFPLENFRKMTQTKSDQEKVIFEREFTRDVKKHIQDISDKYILPQEKTVDFALMYVPSESIYYEVIREHQELQDFARNKKVLLVSPNSFYYFLQVIMIGLEGKKVEEKAERILEILKAVRLSSQELEQALSVLSRHITNAKGAIDQVINKHRQLDSKIDGVRLLK